MYKIIVEGKEFKVSNKKAAKKMLREITILDPKIALSIEKVKCVLNKLVRS